MKKIILFLVIAILYGCEPELKQAVPVNIECAVIDTVYKDFVVECKRREGFRPTAYKCAAGKETIGYGQTKFDCDSMSKKEATEDLHNTLDQIYKQVQLELKGHNRNQHLAVTLLVYNIGFKRLKGYKLWNKIKDKEAVYTDWLSISNYRNPKTKKMVRSENLYQSRKFEIWLYESNIKHVKKQTDRTIEIYDL